MDAWFFDTSAVIKCHVAERGSTWVRALSRSAIGGILRISQVAVVEFTSAITRRERGGNLTPVHAARALSDFRHDLLTRYEAVEITSAIISSAAALARKHGLRGYDAVQLACAMEVHAEFAAVGLVLTLISSDAELNAAAAAEGLAVDDPNNHP